MGDKAGPIAMGLAYLVLVVFMILFIGHETDNAGDFGLYWAYFATLVGVVTGAIPSYFFAGKVGAAQDRADKEATKAQLYAAAAGTDEAQRIRSENQQLFK